MVTFLGVAVVTALIFVSLQPYRPMLSRHGAPFHAVAHVSGFGAAALFLCGPRRTRTQELWVIVFLLVLAITLERLQYVAGRDIFEWNDVLDDSVGILAAPFLLKWNRLRSWLSSS